MKKVATLSIVISLVICCGPKQEKVERTIEDGVEVVINHLEPYQIGEKSMLRLEEILKIDTEDDNISNLGIPDIYGFVVNSLGEIFILRTVTGEGDCIFKFDENGKFIKSFGPQGQGPGEFQNPHHVALDNKENILVLDLGRQALLKFDKDGVFIETYRGIEGISVSSNPGANLLVLDKLLAPENGQPLYSSSLKLMNPDLEVLQVIDELKIEVMNAGKMRAIEPLFYWSTSDENIYVANGKRGYEIWVYDSNGKLIRKIRKEYRQTPVSETYKEKFLKRIPEGAREALRDTLYFPEYLPPFQSLTADDDGTLLVMTYEEGDRRGEFMCDIFNKDGVFIGRKSLNIWVWEGHLWARMSADKFYSLQEKANGYKALYVYRMSWE
jgi:hypothetical protein